VNRAIFIKRRKKEEGRRKKEEGRGKKAEGCSYSLYIVEEIDTPSLWQISGLVIGYTVSRAVSIAVDS